MNNPALAAARAACQKAADIRDELANIIAIGALDGYPPDERLLARYGEARAVAGAAEDALADAYLDALAADVASGATARAA